MRKLYFVASVPFESKDNVITGVVANGKGRVASHEEVGQLIGELRVRGATPSLLEALREETYSRVSAFDRRAAARAEAATLNGWGSCFKWHVIEVGDRVRKAVVKPLGWRILTGWSPSAFNCCSEATIRVKHASRFNGDVDANYLFPNRAAARRVMSRNGIGRAEGYTLVPVYADA